MRTLGLVIGTSGIALGFSALVLHGITVLVEGASKYGWRYPAVWLIGGPLLAAIPASVLYGFARYEKWMERTG